MKDENVAGRAGSRPFQTIKMRRFITVVILLLFSSSVVNADELGIGKTDKNILKSVLDANYIALQTVKSLVFDESITYRYNPGVLKYNPRLRDNDEMLQSFHYEGKGNSYFQSISSTTKNGEKTPEVRVAYNGEIQQRFDTNGGLLCITKLYSHDEDGNFDAKNLITSLFDFLVDDEGASSMNTLSLEQLNSKQTWDKFLSEATEIKISSQDGTQFITAKRKNAQGIIDVVYFNNSPPYLPIKWERTKSDGSLVRRIEITKYSTLSRMNGLSYPASGTIECYLNGLPTVTFTENIDKFSIDKPISEDIFLLDPGMATHIWDADKKTMISVPR
jgi:hypothetical protein